MRDAHALDDDCPLAARPRHRLFSYDLARRLGFTEALEGGVAQPAVWRPLPECDVRHQFGLHPVRASHAWHLGAERARRLRQAVELLSQILRDLHREACANLAGIAELAVVVD